VQSHIVIKTPHFDLVPASRELIEAVLAGDRRAAESHLGAKLPVGWPDDDGQREGLPIHLAGLDRDPSEWLWRIRFVVLRELREAVGTVNMKGKPHSGTVDVGWWVDTPHRRRGIATESSQAVIEWARSHREVRRITARILPDNHVSMTLAERLGMHRTQETHEGRWIVWELAITQD